MLMFDLEFYLVNFKRCAANAQLISPCSLCALEAAWAWESAAAGGRRSGAGGRSVEAAGGAGRDLQTRRVQQPLHIREGSLDWVLLKSNSESFNNPANVWSSNCYLVPTQSSFILIWVSKLTLFLHFQKAAYVLPLLKGGEWVRK